MSRVPEEATGILIIEYDSLIVISLVQYWENAEIAEKKIYDIEV
jgi:hypothetical protein